MTPDNATLILLGSLVGIWALIIGGVLVYGRWYTRGGGKR